MICPEVCAFIEKNLINKKREDFYMLNEKEKYFLFLMRYRYLEYKNLKKKMFYCSAKQFGYMKFLFSKFKHLVLEII